MTIKNMTEKINDSFTEASISANTIRNVAIMGSPVSKNGYTYTEQAMKSLSRLVNGAKFFVNHPSHQEEKDRDGVRSMHDFAGVFSDGRIQGNKVLANLRVRDQFKPLLLDIIQLNPHGVGMSINSRVKVYKDDEGQESVLDIVSLKSVDLVSSAATTTSLFESHNDKKTEQELEDELDFHELFLQEKYAHRTFSGDFKQYMEMIEKSPEDRSQDYTNYTEEQEAEIYSETFKKFGKEVIEHLAETGDFDPDYVVEKDKREQAKNRFMKILDSNPWQHN